MFGLDLKEFWSAPGGVLGVFMCFVGLTGSILGMDVGGEGFWVD